LFVYNAGAAGLQRIRTLLQKQPLRCRVMETVSVEECIRVGAAFDNGKVRPVWFLWRNRYYRVKAVNFTWRSNQGAARLHHYSVTDGNSAYELCFNSSTMEWTLSKVCME